MATQKDCFEEPDWDKRYREGFYSGRLTPHELLVRHSGLFRPGGLIIDVAMGTGRDLLFLAERGFRVCGIEKSAEGIGIARSAARERNLELDVVRGDAARLPFKHRIADGLIVFYFLLREIFPEIVAMLRPGGILVYETYLLRHNMIDQPKNPAFLLEDGELGCRLNGLDVVHYEEGVFELDGKQRAVARFVGRKT